MLKRVQHDALFKKICFKMHHGFVLIKKNSSHLAVGFPMKCHSRV